MPDAGHLSAGVEPDGDDVDAALCGQAGLPRHVVIRDGEEVSYLGTGDGLFRRAVEGAGAGANFDEDEGIVFAGDDIYLTVLTAVVGFDYLVAVAPEIAGGDTLTQIAYLTPFHPVP